MGKILINSRGKSRYVNISKKTHGILCVLKIMFPEDTPVKLGKYMFKISEIEPWPPAEQEKLL